MFTAKVGLAIAAMIAVTFQPAIADATHAMPSLPWGAQLGVTGLIGSLLWWQMAKVGPAESERRSQDLDRMLSVHRETANGISTDIKEMTVEIKSMRESTQTLCNTLASRPCMVEKP